MPEESLVDASSVDTAPLSDNGKELLNVSLRRFAEDSRSLDTRFLREQFEQEYFEHIEFAAEAAKAQMEKQFDGHMPGQKYFGIDHINPAYLGYDAWGNMPDVAQGTETDYLDGATPDNLSGSSSNPLTVGDEAVHLILGWRSFEASPKASRLELRINDQPRAAISLHDYFRVTDSRLLWQDDPIVLGEDDDLEADVVGFQAGSEALAPVGFTFIDGKSANDVLPSDLSDTTTDGAVVVEN